MNNQHDEEAQHAEAMQAEAEAQQAQYANLAEYEQMIEELEAREPSAACPGCAVPCGMCETEIQYIAQSPEDYNAAQARIKELEQENAILKILLAGWVDTFGGQLKEGGGNMRDAMEALGRK